MRKAEDAEPVVVDAPLVVRDERGHRTGDFKSVRIAMGMPP
jgi:predicted nuclease with RNAse H fold